MARKSDIPSFGNLSGLKVLVSAVSTAGPFAGSLYAANGADVIWMESPYGLDALRWSFDGWAVETERKNMRSFSLDVRKPNGAVIFEKLIAEVDIFIEASRGGQWTKWGYPDEKLWELNPRLVIAHMSGYGQTGLDSYVQRPAYDQIMQAYSGMMNMNGFPDRDPVRAERLVTDYFNGLFAYGSTLAAYVHAKATGEGESIDLAQFEAAIACQGDVMAKWFGDRVQLPRFGCNSPETAGYGYYNCADGKGVFLMLMNQTNYVRFMPLVGMEYGVDCPPDAVTIKKTDERGMEFERRVRDFFASRDSKTAEDELTALNIPCTRVMDYEMMESDPHMLARGTFVEWKNLEGETIKNHDFFPRFKKNPSRMWRPAPKIGMDGADICRDLGYSEEEIAALREEGVFVEKDMIRRKM